MQKLPLGISDFKKIIDENYLFVDKSLLIKEFWDSSGETILLPRPRRFGKTLNMIMIKYFFQANNSDNNYLFSNLAISKCKEIMKLQGKYPVIYLSFKDEKYSNFEYLIEGIKNVFSKLFIEHEYCLNNPKLHDIDKKYYNSIINKNATIVELSLALKNLSEYIYNYFDKKVIILVDEYDVPIQAAYVNNYYDEAIEFMRNLLSGAFKDNYSLQKGMITGILRVAKESIFSGLNNLKVESILSDSFSDKFGFTNAEIENLVLTYNIKDKINDIKKWYNGYYFGSTVIYNPWSILNYLSAPSAGLKPYWVNSSSNDLVNIFFRRGSEEVKKDLEVTTLYYGLIESWFKDTITKQNYNLMINSLVTGDTKIFGKLLKQFVLKSISYFDVGGYEGEKVYPAFVLGMLISLNDTHEVLSNRESGYGRYDVMIIPRDISKLGIVIEFKKLDPDDEETLEETAKEALNQINDKKYVTTLKDRGILNIKKIAIIFKGKELYIKEP